MCEERPTFDLKLQVAEEFRHAEEADGLHDPSITSNSCNPPQVEHLAGLVLVTTDASKNSWSFFEEFSSTWPQQIYCC